MRIALCECLHDVVGVGGGGGSDNDNDDDDDDDDEYLWNITYNIVA